MNTQRLYQWRLEGIDSNGDLKESTPETLINWTEGNMGGMIDKTHQIYSLQIYGMPGTQFYLNDGLIPIELGPSGYYTLELNNFAGIYKLVFDEFTLKTLYGTEGYNFVPLVVDAKIQTNVFYQIEGRVN